jgi:hypothetical protein
VTKRRLLHHRSLLHEISLWSFVSFISIFPLVATVYYSRGMDIASIDWVRAALIAVAVGAGQGWLNWFKNTR